VVVSAGGDGETMGKISSSLTIWRRDFGAGDIALVPIQPKSKRQRAEYIKR